jgi:predicted nucleic acid-binding protein
MVDAVFDTTVLIDAFKGHERAVTLLAAARVDRFDAAYSPVTVYELWLRTMSRFEEMFHASAIAALREIPFDSTSARQVGLWLRGYTRSQRLQRASDAMIAATAASLGATIYTRNPRDFSRFYTDVESY